MFWKGIFNLKICKMEFRFFRRPSFLFWKSPPILLLVTYWAHIWLNSSFIYLESMYWVWITTLKIPNQTNSSCPVNTSNLSFGVAQTTTTSYYIHLMVLAREAAKYCITVHCSSIQKNDLQFVRTDAFPINFNCNST